MERDYGEPPAGFQRAFGGIKAVFKLAKFAVDMHADRLKRPRRRVFFLMRFMSQRAADNMRKFGGFIPGIRPGKNTADYMNRILTRITVVGGLEKNSGTGGKATGTPRARAPSSICSL